MNQEIKIGKYTISNYGKPFIIAEMSGNHNHSLDTAMEIIKVAAEAGADAIKLQTYTADTLTINATGGLFDIKDEKSLWNGMNLYQLYQKAYTPWEWHKPMFEYAKKLGILCFSTPFDETAVDFLEEFDVPAYKIASFENNYHDLLKKIATTGKPVIMSTGLSTVEDIAESVEVLRSNGCKELALLKCTSTYPADPTESNIKTIPHMSQLFNCPVGLSDHTLGIGVPLAAVSLGACIIEKHIKISSEDVSVDSAFSLSAAEFRQLVAEAERTWQSLGKASYQVQKSEVNSIRFKRSVYITRPMKEGEVFTAENLRVIRPGDGIHPKYYQMLLGKKCAKDIERPVPFSWEYIA